MACQTSVENCRRRPVGEGNDQGHTAISDQRGEVEMFMKTLYSWIKAISNNLGSVTVTFWLRQRTSVMHIDTIMYIVDSFSVFSISYFSRCGTLQKRQAKEYAIYCRYDIRYAINYGMLVISAYLQNL